MKAKTIILTTLLSLFLTFSYSKELPHPYNTLETILPFNPHNMYVNGAAMKKLIKSNNVRVIIEVGSWLGGSTRHFARLVPENGKVYAIDHWLGSIEHHNPSSEGYKYLPTLYEQFLSNVIHEKLTHKIIPIRKKSTEAIQIIKQLNVQPDLIYIDAAHDEQNVYQDLCTWYPLVQNRGILCGDDWATGISEHAPVQRTVMRFAKERNLNVKSYGNLWIIVE